MAIYTIGQIAKLSNTTVESIRFYEKGKLLDSPRRLPNGYRQYSDDTIIRLRFIQNAKEAGFTLKEIKELLSLSTDTKTSCSKVKTKVLNKLSSVEEKINALVSVKGTLQRLADKCDSSTRLKGCPVIDAFETHHRNVNE